MYRINFYTYLRCVAFTAALFSGAWHLPLHAEPFILLHFSHQNESIPDTAAPLRILMLNYSAYDTAYPSKIHRFIQRHLPNAVFVDFWDGNIQDLEQTLVQEDISCVVVPYPAGGQDHKLQAYGKVLSAFVKNGGGIVVTGTHVFPVLQQLGLIGVDHGYFCAEPDFSENEPQHPVFAETPRHFPLTNYVYPLDVNDPAFIHLAELGGCKVIGYKQLGSGKIVYVGIEFYYDEPNANRILSNAVKWVAKKESTHPDSDLAASQTEIRPSHSPAAGGVRRSEETLYAGSGGQDKIDIKAYPNPYFDKGILDIELGRTATVQVDMIDERGGSVGLLLPQRNLNQGLYRLELPNVTPGVYYIRCTIDGRSTVRKVVKATGP